MDSPPGCKFRRAVVPPCRYGPSVLHGLDLLPQQAPSHSPARRDTSRVFPSCAHGYAPSHAHGSAYHPLCFLHTSPCVVRGPSPACAPSMGSDSMYRNRSSAARRAIMCVGGRSLPCKRVEVCLKSMCHLKARGICEHDRRFAMASLGVGLLRWQLREP